MLSKEINIIRLSFSDQDSDYSNEGDEGKADGNQEAPTPDALSLNNPNNVFLQNPNANGMVILGNPNQGNQNDDDKKKKDNKEKVQDPKLLDKKKPPTNPNAKKKLVIKN
jgi:hypothetical protein